MKRILIISRSYQTGGAAIVAQRLLKALRLQTDVEVRMLVLTNDIPADEQSADVACYAQPGLCKVWNIAAERAELWCANGLHKSRVFLIDTARHGYRLDRHPWVAWADVIHLHWINQGALSLRAVEAMAKAGKRIVWTMHDMWAMTGICHHAYDCRAFQQDCARCPHLTALPYLRTTAQRTLHRKEHVYNCGDQHFVAISNWALNLAKSSTLLHNRKLSLIANPHPIHLYDAHAREKDEYIVIAIGAARLDDEVKGFDIFLQVSEALHNEHPQLSKRIRFVLYGALRNIALLQDIRQRYDYLGLQDAQGVRHVLEHADICLSTSRFETLPNALIEGAAAGCILVSFVTGGQADILQDGINGYAAQAYDASHMAQCIAQAANELSPERREKQHADMLRYSAENIARQYIEQCYLV